MLDRNAAVVTFRIDGLSVTQALSTTVFAAAEPYRIVNFSAESGANFIGYVDDIRTAPAALTPSEVQAGNSEPPAFPVAPDPASFIVDSTIAKPFEDLQTLDFIAGCAIWIFGINAVVAANQALNTLKMQQRLK